MEGAFDVQRKHNLSRIYTVRALATIIHGMIVAAVVVAAQVAREHGKVQKKRDTCLWSLLMCGGWTFLASGRVIPTLLPGRLILG